MAGSIARPPGRRSTCSLRKALGCMSCPSKRTRPPLVNRGPSGTTRRRWGSVRYSTPDGHQGTQVWCRVVGEELVLTARTPTGLAELCRHQLSTPGRPQILDAHYPHHPGGNGPKP